MTKMGAANSRGKSLIVIISVVGLLLAILLASLFASNPVEDGPSSASSQAVRSAANDMAPKHVATPSVVETGPDIASNMRVDEQTPLTKSPDQQNGAEREAHADDVAAPAADSSGGRNADPRRTRVAAECWGLRGGAPHDFVVTLDREVRTSGEASALISSLRNKTSYATLYQTAAATPVRGKRVEFSADIRTRGATDGANLLLRAEDAHGNTVAFDNMVTSYDVDRRLDQLVNRGVKGDTEWSTQHVVVDIPDDARVITYGVSLFGGGKAWIDNARIEVVSNDMATTAVDILQSPTPVHGIPINPASLTRSPRNLEFDLEAKAGAVPCN